MNRSALERQITLGFALASLILLLIGTASYVAIARLVVSGRVATGSAELIAPLERVYHDTERAESALRGYLLTGQTDYLQEHRAAATRVEERLRTLEDRADSSDLVAGVKRLRRLVAARLALLRRVLDQAGGDPAGARALVAQGIGRDEMAALRAEVRQLVAAQEARLQAEAELTERRSRQVFVYLLLAVVFLGVLLAVLYQVIRREVRGRVSAFAAAEEGEARLRAVVDTAVDAIIVIDERGRIERFNRSAERMFGYRADEVLGENVAMLMPSPYREEHDGYMSRYLRTGEKRIIGIGREVLAQRRDGSTFPIDLAVAEFRVGARRMFTGMIRDISERKAAEARQEALLQEVTAANEELKNFAYVASHDLKAPLRAIASLAEWIAADYADKFDDEGREHLRLLLGRVTRMDRLIDGILQYSRVGRVKENRVAVDLNELLAETVDLLAPGPQFQVTVDPLPQVQAERTRLAQLFQNLISNAIRYMDKPEGRIHVACRDEGRHWHFSVADNGPGIEARHFERIFLMFQTLAPRDKTESTGIGLSLVKKIVELYGGQVWVESRVGEGSTFHFTLAKSALQGAREEASSS